MKNRKDLRTYLKQVMNHPDIDVVHVLEHVDRDQQLADVVKLAEKENNPIFIFEDVSESELPVVSGLYASRNRIAAALGVESPEETVPAYLHGLKNPVPTKRVRKAPVHEVILENDDIDLGLLPIVRHTAHDSGRYITAGVGLVREPSSGVINAGIYRMQIIDEKRLTVYAVPTHDLGVIISKARKSGRRIPFAVVIGHHPAFTLASQADVPADKVDSLEVAGALLGNPLEVIPARTVPLDVPANAEIVIEGYIDPRDTLPDGPFAEFTYYYGAGESVPILTVESITMRHDAMYVDVHNAHVEHRCLFMHPGYEARLYERVKSVAPSLHAVEMPFDGAGMLGIISFREPEDGEVERGMLAALQHEKMFLKHVVAVDHSVDISDLGQITWAVMTHFQADRSLISLDGPGFPLDPSSLREDGKHVTRKLGFDATTPAHMKEAPLANLLQDGNGNRE